MLPGPRGGGFRGHGLVRHDDAAGTV